MGRVEKLRHIANQQRGYFTTRQAMDAGYSHFLQNYHVTNGDWVKIDRSVYRLAGCSESFESQFVRWSLWAVGRDQKRIIAVSHYSALQYYGLFDGCMDVVHLSVTTSVRRQKMPPGCVLHLRDLRPDEYVWKAGFYVTTPYRTLCDMRPDLTYMSQWNDTVCAALGKGVIDRATAEELLGELRTNAMLPAQRPWAGSIHEADTAMTGGKGFGDSQRSKSMSTENTRLRIERQKGSEWRMPNRSFTLVELLIVIAIMCVLMSFLLPALNRSLDISRQVTCANNLRIQGTATITYTTDYHGYLPTWDDNCSSSWADRLFTPAEKMRLYITEDIGVFWCDSCTDTCKTNRVTSGSWSWINMGRTQYAVNQYAAYTDRNQRTRRINRIGNPSSIVWSACFNNGLYIYTQRAIQPVEYWNNWLTGPSQLITQFSDLRHLDLSGTNYSYLDGHIKGQYGYPPMTSWVPGRTVD